MSGSVTSPTGSVKGHSLTGLVDAYTGNWSGLNGTYDGTTAPMSGAQAQAQHVVMLSDQTGACSRKGSGGPYAGSELTVRLTMITYADLSGSITTIPAATDVPLTFTAGTWLTTSDGAHRVVNPYFMQARNNGGAGSDVAATGGTVTFTRMDSVAYEGSYDLYFNGDHITGSFAAPWC